MKDKLNIFFWNNRLLWASILIAAATLLSMIKPVVLPQGGAATFFSLLFLWLLTFYFGPKYGFFASLVFCLFKFLTVYITGEYVNYQPLALILEYPLANAAFCVGGFMKEEITKGDCADTGKMIDGSSFKLIVGYVIGVCLQCFFYVVSAVLFYPPDRAGFWENLLFCIQYDASYLFLECGTTVLVLLVPAVRDAIFYIRYVATTELEDETMIMF